MLPDGRFSFGNVPPGRYQIRARGQTEPAGPSLSATFTIHVQGSDIEGIRLTLQPGGVLEGRLIVERRKGTRPPRLQDLRVRTVSADGGGFDDPVGGAVRQDGSFALRGVTGGSHLIVIDGLQAPWIVKEILYRGADVTHHEIHVRDKDRLRDIRVTLTDLSAAVSPVGTPRVASPTALAALR